MKNNDIYCLLIPKEEAKQLLLDRLELGKKILRPEITNDTELAETTARYENWRDYNITLLRKVFDDEILVDSHFSFPSIMSTRHKSLKEKKSLFVGDLNWHINKLKSTIDKFDLFEPKEKKISENSNDVIFSGNRVDNFFNKLKNHKVLSAFIIFFILLIALATVTDSFSKLYDLFKSFGKAEVSENDSKNLEDILVEKQPITDGGHERSENKNDALKEANFIDTLSSIKKENKIIDKKEEKPINIGKVEGDVVISQNQSGGITAKNVEINTDRRLDKNNYDLLIDGLGKNPCEITVGALGMGGEPNYLADQLLLAATQAGCKVNGVYHGVGFEPFVGIRIIYSTVSVPVKSIAIIENIFNNMNLLYIKIPDSSRNEGSIYLYVGYKP